MKLSIIIPAYNAAATLEECLNACHYQTHPAHEIIVVDDGSTDNTLEIAQNAVGVIAITQENAGPATARNRGAKEATGEVYVMTDSDCVPAPDWLEQIAQSLEAHPQWVAVGGTYTIMNPESTLARVIQAEIEVRHARFGEEVDFLGSFNVAYRAEAFDAIGGFDESYPKASGEDNDLAYRLQDAGGTLGFNPHAKVGHYHPTKLWPYLKTQQGHGYWRMKLYKDHKGRTKSGDNYAPIGELLGVPMTLLCVALSFIGSFLFRNFILENWWVFMLYVYGFGIGLALIHIPIAKDIKKKLDTREGSRYPLLAVIRDFARGCGMLNGFFDFHIRGRTS